MKISSLVLPSLALGAAALMIIPGSDSQAFSFTGAILNLGQRDYRVRNNFSDAATNNNNTAHPMFPGATGVFMATWKGAAEWGSELHGTGTGDPSQGMLGSGAANFDAFWAGISTGVGQVGENIVSATTGCPTGVIAFAESTVSAGWRIRFCDDQWTFADGPGGPGGQIDFQTIMCHEYGHALGLGHSADGGATMFPSYSGGTAGRSINNDDIAGVQALYGAKAGSKPMICKTSASGGMLTITGENFDPTGNIVWFKRSANTAPGGGPILVVTGNNSSNGGTTITLPIPAAAGPGDVAVRLSGSANTYSLLSNCFPTDLVGTIEGDCPYGVSSASPSTIQALEPGTSQFLTLSGTGFNTVTSITLEPGIAIAPSSYTVVNDGTITIDMPTATALGTNTLTLDGSLGATTFDIDVVSGQVPVIQIGSGDALNQIADGETFSAVLSGTPGHAHRIYYSLSNVPSSFPLASFLIGNNFSQINVGPTVVIGANGIGGLSMPLSYAGGGNTTFYVQSLGLTAGTNPVFEISNLQSVVFTP